MSQYLYSGGTDTFLKPLMVLYETSLKVSNVQIEWNIASVVSVFKKGDKVAQNYRPVTLTNITFKILENIIRKQTAENFTDTGCLT